MIYQVAKIWAKGHARYNLEVQLQVLFLCVAGKDINLKNI